mmetsp:Transcript_1299/g.2883  ORF Transcript_1299/g.2883 Transcript_1299/m.2883 type:complete len:226 (+) Transcript_1299:383-1060(+)
MMSLSKHFGCCAPKASDILDAPLASKQGGTPLSSMSSSPSRSSRILRGSLKHPEVLSGAAQHWLTATVASGKPRPQHVERNVKRKGWTGGRDLKVPTTTGHCSKRCISHPPSSSHLSPSGDGLLASKLKPAGETMSKERPASKHRSVSPSLGSAARRSVKGPMEVPSRAIIPCTAPSQNAAPCAGTASSGTCSLSHASQRKPSEKVTSSASSRSSSSSSSAGGTR